MRIIILRIGQVLWWLAAAAICAGAAGSVVKLFEGNSEWPAFFVMGCIFASPMLVLCYIITGSIKRPPRPE